MSVLTYDGLHSTMNVARRLGVSYSTIIRLAARWYETGSGYRVRLTDTDVMVCRAWVTLTTAHAARSKGRHQEVSRAFAVAEAAIRDHPRRWLLLGPTRAITFDQAETAAEAWLRWPPPRNGTWLIDLDPGEVA